MSSSSDRGSTAVPVGAGGLDRSTGAAGRRTVIAPSVVAIVAGVAAGGVRGVHGLGGSAATDGVLGRVRAALPGSDPSTEGVQVEVGTVQAAFDLSVVAEYGMPLRDLAEQVRERVIAQVEDLTGYEVTEVNIAVVDVHLDEEDES